VIPVYVTDRAREQGIGRELLDRLIRDAEADGIWTIQTSIFPENEASLALHQRCGFRTVGTRERIAQLDGVWRDTLLMERRSTAW
jgi:L-amino acid N-acyltransferase YncA